MDRSGLLLVVLVVAVLAVQPSFAGDNNYVVLKSGIYSPQSESLSHFDTGLTGDYV